MRSVPPGAYFDTLDKAVTQDRRQPEKKPEASP